jgi:Na+-transporting NADH:ubiquinone oxidoreductase subunit NqrC
MPVLNPNNPLNRSIALSNLFWIILVLILLAGNIFFGLKYSAVQKELKLTQTSLETQKTNEKILDFAKLFIEKVLKAETEVDFETRLKLENAVRNLGDEEILEQWNKFVNSKTEAEAQEQVKNLLEMLVNKIKVQ